MRPVPLRETLTPPLALQVSAALSEQCGCRGSQGSGGHRNARPLGAVVRTLKLLSRVGNRWSAGSKGGHHVTCCYRPSEKSLEEQRQRPDAWLGGGGQHRKFPPTPAPISVPSLSRCWPPFSPPTEDSQWGRALGPHPSAQSPRIPPSATSGSASTPPQRRRRAQPRCPSGTPPWCPPPPTITP